MYDLILAFITSFSLTYLAIPSIIKLAIKKNLMDEPDHRRTHKVSTPSLGGIAILSGTLFSIIMWTPFTYFGELQYILCGFIIIFLLGAKDDLDPVTPVKKIIVEIFTAIILVFKANVKITSMYGIFGLGALPEWISILLSIFTILVIINAFNLIDGIDGLSGTIGLLVASLFGLWFYMTGSIELSMIAFSLTGAIVAFLKYNFTPASIFMGDTGSLFIGLVCSILAIKFIEFQPQASNSALITTSAPAVTIAILVIPLFDTLRVFVLRIWHRQSPFKPDRRHVHHILVDLGFTHLQSVLTLVLVNVLVIGTSLCLQHLGNGIVLITILILVSSLSGIGAKFVSSKKNGSQL
jgi:UDP-GlcNAc:undecaprenyl-phosphate GlcNAc-1-phosphate transferase